MQTVTVTVQPGKEITINGREVPTGWEIYCASRPLAGSQPWNDHQPLATQGLNFEPIERWLKDGELPGRLLAAVDPSDPLADTWRTMNAHQHAVRVLVANEED